MTPSANPEEELRILIQKIARRIKSERAESDISDSQLSVLWRVASGVQHTPGSLAEQERVSRPSMNRTVNALEKSGYIRREPSKIDARQVIIRLTPLGATYLSETRRRRSEWFHDRLAELTPRERALLDRANPILRKVADD